MEKRGKCVKGEEGGKANAWASSLLFCPSHSCLCFGASLEIWGWRVSRVPEVRCLDGELGLVQVGIQCCRTRVSSPLAAVPMPGGQGAERCVLVSPATTSSIQRPPPSMVRDHKITLYHTGMCLHEGTNCFVANQQAHPEKHLKSWFIYSQLIQEQICYPWLKVVCWQLPKSSTGWPATSSRICLSQAFQQNPPQNSNNNFL